MLFNTIGKTYNHTRIADDRIAGELIRLMGVEKGFYPSTSTINPCTACMYVDIPLIKIVL